MQDAAVSTDGDVLVVGAPHQASVAINGAVYVYRFDSSTFQLEQELDRE